MRCGLCALLLSIVVRGQVEYFPIFNENVTKCDNAITEEMTSKPWLISEHVPGGFCNQLFGVFSTAPIAKLIGANLILGPLFSRRSFQTSYEDFTDNMVKLPYSAFFDVKHMRNFWHSRGVEIVQKMDVKACMNVNSIVTIWKPRFFSYSDAEIMQVIETNWTLPFPPGAGVLFTNEHSMTAFYDHLQSGRNLIIKGDEDVEDIPNKHLLQLGDMYNSLLPNTKIKGITQQILNRLGYDFIGIHLRLETDAFDSDFDFEVALDAALNEIKKHKCLESYTGGDDSTFSLYNPPSIYIASGIFSNNVTLNAVETFSSLYRATAVLRAFKDAGFTSIITKSSPMFRDVLPRLKLYAEQHAYSDVLVLQQSYCFIPALPYESSFSHVVERFRQFRGGDYGGVIGNVNLFEAWGF